MSIWRKKNLDKILLTNERNDLKKSLGILDLTFLGIGAIIGTGIFVLVGPGAVQAGPALTISFIIAAIACGFSALAYAEFASTIPISGSIYTYSYFTIGELAAWIIGWDLMLEYGLASSAVSSGWSGYLQSFLANFNINLPTIFTAAPGSIHGVTTYFNLPAFLIVIAITSLLSVGINESTKVNNIIVFIKISIIIIVIITGVFHIEIKNWQPFMPYGWSSVFGAASIMFFAFIGFDAISSAAEEAKNPKRDLPISIIASLIFCALLYIIISAIATGIIPSQKFLGVMNPVSYALQVANERFIASFIDIGAVFGMLTVILVMMYGQTRIIFSMSRDGLLPSIFSRIHSRFETPFISTWILGIFFGIIGAVIPLNLLAELINIGTLAAFSMVSISVLILRKTYPNLPRAFRCPGVPFIPILSIIACIFLMINLQFITIISFIVWIIIGIFIYFVYSKNHSKLL